MTNFDKSLLDALLHPSQESSLADLPTDRPVSLLARHSVRDGPKSGVASYHLPLTDEGVALAEVWGGKLDRPVSAWHSSPVQRCQDTALAMARGAGKGLVEVSSEMTLVEPGCYVQSLRKVNEFFIKHGPVIFIDNHLRSPMDGLLSPDAGANKILHYLKAKQGLAGSIDVHVTHDTILATFIYHLAGHSSIDEERWPLMMEGAYIWFDDANKNKVHWIWRGECGHYEFEYGQETI